MANFQLVFDGPCDSEQETLRKLKGVFIAELDCSVDQVVEYLDQTPAVIFSSDNQEEIEKMEALLLCSGAIVHVERNGDASPPQEPEEPQEDPEQSKQPEENDDSGDAIEFSFDLDELEEEPKRTKPKEQKVYSLDFNPEDDLTDISNTLLSFGDEENEALEEDEPSPIEIVPAEDIEEPAEIPSLDLSFEEDDDEIEEVEVKEESPAKPETHEVPDFDLSLSFDDESLEELQEDNGFDPNVAGGGTNWDLSFEDSSENDPQEEENQPSDETSDSEELPVEEEAPSEAPTMALGFETEEKEEVEEIAKEATVSEPEVPEKNEETITAAVDSLDMFSSDSEEDPEVVHENELIPEEKDELEEVEEEVNEEIIPQAATAQRATSKPNIKKSFQNLPLLAIALVLLLGGNGYFLWTNFLAAPGGSGGLSEESLETMIASAAKRSKQPVRDEQIQIEPKLPKMILSGKHGTPQGSVTWNIISQGDLLLEGTIVFMAKKPKPLSKLEIARKVTPRPWVHKAELDKITFSEPTDGQQHSSSPVRIFIQQGDQRRRIVGVGTVVLAYSSKDDLIAGTLLISPKDASVSGSPHFSISGDTVSGYEYSLETEWVATGGAKEMEEEN